MLFRSAAILSAIERDDARAFVATIPRGGRVVLGGRPRQAAAAVTAYLRRRGVRASLGPTVAASVAGQDGDPILVLASAEQLDGAPEAAFRWDAMNGRWDLISLQAPVPP